MNINSFSQPSTLSSEKSSAQGSPLENLMGTMPDGEGENPTFSLDNLLPAFDEPELAANGEEQDIVPDVQIGDTALVQTPADEATQLLNYLLKGESSAATGEVRIGRRGAGAPCDDGAALLGGHRCRGFCRRGSRGGAGQTCLARQGYGRAALCIFF